MIPLAVALALIIVGCEQPGADGEVLAVDSAGIEIVTTPEMFAVSRWQVDPEPIVTIGRGDGADAIGGVAGAFRDSNGNILILDYQARELRYYSEDGRRIRVVGRPGSGPGEIPPLRPLFPAPLHDHRILLPWPGDSVAIHGMREGVLQVMDAAGTEARRLELPDLRKWAQSWDEGGRLLLATSTGEPDGPIVDGWRTTSLDVFDMDGTVSNVMNVPMREVRNDGEVGAWGFWAPTPNGIVAGKSNVPELRYFDWSGKAVRIVRFPFSSDAFHSISRIHVDSEEAIWMAPRAHEMTAAVDSLWVVDPAGRYHGGVALPNRFFPVDIGHGWMLGVWRDSLDVEYLRLHGLIREPSNDH